MCVLYCFVTTVILGFVGVSFGRSMVSTANRQSWIDCRVKHDKLNQIKLLILRLGPNIFSDNLTFEGTTAAKVD